jgi:uncharacterized membrane protein YkoI
MRVMDITRRSLLAIVCALGLVRAGSLAAQAPLSLDQAVSKVRQQTGGQVVRAETKQADGRTVHVIRILTGEGRVRTLEVDAQSGAISEGR